MVSVEKFKITLENGEAFEITVQEAKTLAKELLGLLKNLQTKEEEN